MRLGNKQQFKRCGWCRWPFDIVALTRKEKNEEKVIWDFQWHYYDTNKNLNIIDFANLKITNPTTMPKCGYITTHIIMFEII